MSTVYEMDYRVNSRDVDLFNQCRPSAVLGFLQEAATQAALALGVSGPQIKEKYNCLWMVTRNWMELDTPLRWNDLIHIKTWHRGASGASSYRDFDLFRDGRPVGQGASVWVMVDAHERKLFRMKNLTEFQGTDGGALNKSIKLRRPAMPEAFGARVRRDLGYSDTDINGHVNNAHYADFACDSLHLERLCRGKLHIPKVLGWLLTFLFVNAAWVFFRAVNVSQALALLRDMCGGGWALPSPEFADALLLPEFEALATFANLAGVGTQGIFYYWLPLLCLPVGMALLALPNPLRQSQSFRPRAWKILVITIALVWSVISLSGVATFIYANF